VPESGVAKTSKVAEEAKEELVDKRDFSLLDNMINSFMETEDDKMLPVLCGYFNKIFQSLLTKEK